MISAIDLEHVLAHTRPLWEALRGRRVFVTGGTGFVGTWLVESLAFANRRLELDVRATILTRSPAAFVRRVPHLADDPAVSFLEGDVAGFHYPAGSFPYVIHGATERHVEADPEHPLSIFDRDTAATRRMLEFARQAGTEKLLFTSSGAVYGRQPPDTPNIPEEYPGAPLPTNGDPLSIYGQGKRVSEFMCAQYAHQYGFDATIARLFAFAGAHLPLDGQYAVGNFVGDVLANRPIRIAGDGTPLRSYLYAADLAIWLWTILLAGRSGTAYNVGSPNAVSIRELADVVAGATVPGTPVEVAKEPVPGALPSRYVPSVTRAETELGLRPWIALEEAVRRMYASFCR